MKNSDIALVILIAALSFGIAYFITNAILGSPNEKFEKIKYIQDISSVIESPDQDTFNAYAKNLNEEVASGKCPYGTTWNGLACVADKTDQSDENNNATEGQVENVAE